MEDISDCELVWQRGHTGGVARRRVASRGVSASSVGGVRSAQQYVRTLAMCASRWVSNHAPLYYHESRRQLPFAGRALVLTYVEVGFAWGWRTCEGEAV